MVDEDLLGELLREAKKHVHFLLDPDDSTYLDVRRNLKIWLARPGVDRDLILQAYAETDKATVPVQPRSFSRYVDKVLHGLALGQAKQAQRWEAARADSPHPGPPQPSRFQAERQSLIDDWKLEGERRRREADRAQGE